jgi:hypothetical protein
VTRRVQTAVDRPRLWRVTAAIAAVVLCALIVVSAQGTIDAYRPARGAGRAVAPAWTRPCVGAPARDDRPLLALCARVDGHVIAIQHDKPGETHLAVLSEFHVMVVKLPPGGRSPGWGSRITAVGPMVRARNGLREIQAFEVHPT